MKLLSVLVVMLLTMELFSAKKTNVIVIMADDISAREFPVYGSSAFTGLRANTPVLDKMATSGCFFGTAWSCTLCKPSRTEIMTGRYATLTKWWDNSDVGKNNEGKMLGVPESSPMLIGHVAQKAGYQTAWVGKTHNTNGSDALNFGFNEGFFTPGEPVSDKNPFDHFRNVGNPSYWNYDSFYWWPEVQKMKCESNGKGTFEWVKTEMSDYGPDLELNFMLDFAKRNVAANIPFFIHYTPHLGHKAIDMADTKFSNTWPGTPVLVWNEKTKSYSREEPSIVANGTPNTKGTSYSQKSITQTEIKYHIEYLDYIVWRIVGQLKEMKEINNTIIIFTSDNATIGYGTASVIRQRGTHVPLIIYASGVKNLVKGERMAVTDLSDILPTLAEIMGTKLPSNDEYPLSGKSLWPYLTGESKTHRDYVYSYKSEKQMIRGQYALCDGNGDWWDVSQTPKDLDSYPSVTDFGSMNPQWNNERMTLEKVLKDFAREDVGGANLINQYPLTEEMKANLKKRKRAAKTDQEE